MADTRQTLYMFAADRAISVWRADRVDSNPNMAGSRGMDNWRVRLRRVGRGDEPSTVWMTVPFSKGYGHNGAPPSVEEVLSALASDAAGFENARSFDEWAREYGYATDDRADRRTAERTYKAVERATNKLRDFLGDAGFNQLVWHTEGL